MSEHIIYLNFASAEELQLIPNVGPVIADAIIALRYTRNFDAHKVRQCGFTNS